MCSLLLGRHLRLIAGVALAFGELPARAVAVSPWGKLSGEYGFLTVFDGISEDEARRRVRDMKDNFMIREFQFYNAFEGYSGPPDASKDGWGTRFFNRPVNRKLLRAYTEEIAKIGGRSWLSIQAMATNPGDKELQNGFQKIGTHSIGDEALLDVIVPNAMWAERVAPQWAEFAASLGFTGIHWDTLGNYLGKQGEQDCDLAGFLQIASVLLRQHGLAQTLNFVDGFGWEPSLETDGLIAFPYWTAGPSQDERDLVSSMDMHGGSVFMEFSNEANKHEEWFKYLKSRWSRAHHGGSVYLAIGDGTHACVSDYLPASLPLTKAEVAAIREEVIGSCQLPLCRQGADVATTTRPCGGPKDMVEGELVLALQPTSDDVDPISSAAREVVAIESVLGQHFGFCAVRIKETLTTQRRLGEGTPDATKLRMTFTGSAPAGAAPREAGSAQTIGLSQEFQAAFDQDHAGVNVQSASVRLNGGEPSSERTLLIMLVGGAVLNILACCLLAVACRRRSQEAGAPQDDDKVPLTQEARAETGAREEVPLKDEEVRLCEAMEKSTDESSEGKEPEREGSETEQKEAQGEKEMEPEREGSEAEQKETQGEKEAAEDAAEEREAGEEEKQQEEQEHEEQVSAREEPGEELAPAKEEKGEEENAAVQGEGKEDTAAGGGAAAEGSAKGEGVPEKGSDESAHA